MEELPTLKSKGAMKQENGGKSIKPFSMSIVYSSQ